MIRIRSTMIMFTVISLGLFTGINCESEPIQPAPSNNDTTSHNFIVLRIDTLGTLFSFANGVDIVDENNIWVAGIFTERDTNKEILYNKNLAHWDGAKWTLMSVPMMGYNNTGPDPQELGAVKVFNDSTIFVVAKHDNSVAWWNGSLWMSAYVTGATVSPNLWARSEKEIYFVAREGRASYYDGKTYIKIETGLTNPPITDVWGGEKSMYATGEGHGGSEGNESVLLKGNKEQWSVIQKYTLSTGNENTNNFIGGMKSIYCNSNDSDLWILGGWNKWRIYHVNTTGPFSPTLMYAFPTDFPAILIRGTSHNDLYVPSSLNSEFYHFNGATWSKFGANVDNLLTLNFTVNKKVWSMSGSIRNGVGTAIIVTGKHHQ